MQNGKTIKTRKNVDFNVDIFILQKNVKKHLHTGNTYVIFEKLTICTSADSENGAAETGGL